MNKIRQDINWFKNNPDYIYMDSGATSLKPNVVTEAIIKYCDHDCTNPHNTNSDFSFKTKKVMSETKQLLADYLDASQDEIAFTPGATFSLNMIADGIIDLFDESHEIVLTNAEHASNILPWFKIREKKNSKIVFAEASIENEKETIKNIISKINKNTKLVSFANGTNLIGNKLNATYLSEEIKKINPNVIIVVDATQYLTLNKMDLKNSKIDFLVGSAHKMLGPSGIGFLYISSRFQSSSKPSVLGGGMNNIIKRSYYTLVNNISAYEAGTPNIMGIYGWNAALKYYSTFNLDDERKRIYELKKYLDECLMKVKDIIVINPNIESSITIFKHKNVYSQDLGSYLGSKKIIVRSGLSCAKLADEIINFNDVVRVSLSFYNTKNEIDKLITELTEYKKGDELDDIL